MDNVKAFSLQMRIGADGSVKLGPWQQLRRKRLAAKRYLRNEIWLRRMIRTSYGVSEYVAAKAIATWNALTPEQRAEVHRTGRMPEAKARTS